MMNIFPRILACADRAANPRPSFGTTETEDFDIAWATFAQKTPKYIKMFEEKGIVYRIPVPGVSARDTTRLTHNDRQINTQVIWKYKFGISMV